MKSRIESFLLAITLLLALDVFLSLVTLISVPKIPACMAVDSSGRCLGAGEIVIP